MDQTPQIRRNCTCVKTYCEHHRKIRAAYQPQIDAGQGQCWRCGDPIPPGSNWDLGHDDHDKNLYRGTECIRCNRSTSTRRKNTRRWVL